MEQNVIQGMSKQEFNQTFWKYKTYVKKLPKKEKADVLINFVGDSIGWVYVMLFVAVLGAPILTHMVEFIKDPKNFFPKVLNRINPTKKGC